jgi:hypothetical protein
MYLVIVTGFNEITRIAGDPEQTAILLIVGLGQCGPGIP